MNNSFSFFFKGYSSNLEKGEILFHFQLKGEKNIDFTEKIYFPQADSRKIPPTLLKSLLDNLMLILGISYWKTYCPKDIKINNVALTKEQANFWNTVYTKGLGEFFYKNKIDFRGIIKFPYDQRLEVKPVLFPRKNRTLLGFGGGKDSIVAAELLKNEKKDFDLFTVGTSLIQEQVAKIMGENPIVIMRHLDPKLFELNKTSNVYNGHIPISVIYAFLGLLAGIFYDYRFVVVGNEKSANYGNVTYLGEIINHQWSKSEEFETLFKVYIHKFVTSDVSYFSLLRNMNELEVAKEFVKYPRYFKVFSSCNTNFKVIRLRPNESRLQRDKWCGKCAKCLFVFTLLSVFISKNELLGIFGQNLFANESLLKSFRELLGLENFKPFECVGTPEEMKEAFSKIAQKKEFNKDFLIKYFLKK